MAVADIITKQQQEATDAIAQGQAFLDTLTALTKVNFDDINAPTIWNYTIFDKSDDALKAAKNEKPDSPTLQELALTLPTDPTFSTVSVKTVSIPEFTESMPELNFPAAPDPTLPQVPDEPVITDPTIPEKPDITLPDEPQIKDITLPDAPTIEIAEFTELMPSDLDTLVEPTTEFEFVEEAYSNELLDAANALILSDLQNGGYGIDPNDELNLWNRAKERELEAMLTLENDIAQSDAKRGFMRPTGSLYDAEDNARNETSKKLSSINRDIAIKKAELYVQNRQFALDKTVQINQMLINYHNAVMERKLNAARIAVELGVRIFEAKLALAKSRLEKYRIAAEVYRQMIQAELAKVEVYKTQMQAKQIEANIQQLSVQIYQARVNAVRTVIDLYRAEMEGAKLYSEIQERLIKIFAQKINAYSEQVRAKVSEFDMYKTQIGAETAKVQNYEALVRAYTAEVSAKKVESDINIQEARQAIEVNRLELEKYRAKVDAARAKLNADVSQVNALISKYGADSSAYSAYMGALADLYRLNDGTAEANARTAIEASRITVDKAKLELQKLESESGLKLNAARAGAQLFTELIGGALSAINTVAAQIETSEGEG